MTYLYRSYLLLGPGQSSPVQMGDIDMNKIVYILD